MDITADQFKEAAKRAAQAGDVATARKLIERARAAEAAVPQKASQPFQRTREFLFGDNDPNTQNLGETIGSTLNKAGEAMTLGTVGDEASAALLTGGRPGDMQTEFDPETGKFRVTGLGPSRYDQRRDFERQQESVLERDNPGLALGAEIGGGVLGAMLPGGQIGTLARGASLPARIGASAGAGAGMGATYGFMEGEGAQDRAEGARVGGTIGGLVGAVVPAVGAGVQKIADSRAAKRAVRGMAENAPSSEELRRIGQALYRQVDDAGVQVKPSSFESARRGIVDNLQGQTAYTPRPGGQTITPKTSAVVRNMADMSDEMAAASAAGQRPGLPFKEIDSLRRQAGAAAGNVAEKSDQQAGMTIIEGLDDFLERIGPDDVLAGDVQALKSALPKARDTWARMSKSQKIDDAIEAAGNYRWGFSNGIKWQFKKILNNPKLSRGFTEAERAAMKRVVAGGPLQNVLDLAGSGLTTIGGMVGAGLGAAGGGVSGAAAGLGVAGASRAARSGANAVSARNAELVRALVANGKATQLPVASDASRRLVEALMRRGAAATAQ